MNYRKIKNASVFFDEENYIKLPEHTEAVELSVITRCPEKYLLVDRETGVVYAGTSETNPHMPKYSLWKEVK
jgi:hypothetical protein